MLVVESKYCMIIIQAMLSAFMAGIVVTIILRSYEADSKAKRSVIIISATLQIALAVYMGMATMIMINSI